MLSRSKFEPRSIYHSAQVSEDCFLLFRTTGCNLKLFGGYSSCDGKNSLINNSDGDLKPTPVFQSCIKVYLTLEMIKL